MNKEACLPCTFLLSLYDHRHGVSLMLICTGPGVSMDGSNSSNQQGGAPLMAAPPHARGAAAPPPVFIGGMSSGATSPRHERFEDFAKQLQAPATLRATQVGQPDWGSMQRSLKEAPGSRKG
jgi:hypothetical protein